MDSDQSQVSLRDHDLLVELRTEMRGVRTDIKEIKDNSAERLNRLEDGKVDKTELMNLKKTSDDIHQDHEDRIRLLEIRIWFSAGGAAVIAFLVGKFLENIKIF